MAGDSGRKGSSTEKSDMPTIKRAIADASGPAPAASSGAGEPTQPMPPTGSDDPTVALAATDKEADRTAAPSAEPRPEAAGAGATAVINRAEPEIAVQGPADAVNEPTDGGAAIDGEPHDEAPAWRKPAIIAGAVVAGLAVLYGSGVALAAGQVPSSAIVGGTDVGGMSLEQATDAIARAGDEIVSRPVVLEAGERSAELDARIHGLSVDPQASAAQLTETTFNPIRVGQRLFGTVTYDFVTTVDEGALREGVERASTLLNAEPRDGSVRIENAGAVVDEASDGIEVKIAPAVSLISGSWPERSTYEVPARVTPPAIDQGDVDEAMSQFVEPALAGPITISIAPKQAGNDAGGDTAGDGQAGAGQPGGEQPDLAGLQTQLTVEQFAQALVIQPRDGALVGEVDGNKLRDIIFDVNPEMGTEARDARIEIVGGAPTIIPGQAGLSLDPDTLRDVFREAIASDERRAAVPSVVAEPEFSTADAEKLGVKEVISSFDSKLPNNAKRTENISIAARTINGTLLKPGETFSMNEILGKRTPEKGYNAAPVIMNGRLAMDYGGGISQMATTLFNGMFFAGLDEIEHKPHSFYISRYPEGREATINWPNVDLKFKNDSPHGVLIETWVSGGAVHTKFWGTKRYEVEAIKGPRTNVRNPQTIVDDSPGCVRQSPSPGFNVTVTRVLRAGGQEVQRESFSHRYIPEDKVTCVPPGSLDQPAPAPDAPAVDAPAQAQGGDE